LLKQENSGIFNEFIIRGILNDIADPPAPLKGDEFTQIYLISRDGDR
jgi:hypothetical protein